MYLNNKLWNNYLELNIKNSSFKINLMQNKAICIIEGVYWREHAGPLYMKLKIFKFQKAVSYSMAKFMLRFSQKQLSSRFEIFFTSFSFIHFCNVRNSSKLNQYFIPRFDLHCYNVLLNSDELNTRIFFLTN